MEKDFNKDFLNLIGLEHKTKSKNSDDVEIKKLIETFMAAGIALFVSFPLTIFLNAFVTMMLWNWFMVILGAPEITLMLALGLNLMIGFLRHRKEPTNAEHSQKVLDNPLYSIITELLSTLLFDGFILSFGYLIHWMM